MRRRNILLVPVDEYLCGVYLSPTTLIDCVNWKKKNDKSTLATILLRKSLNNTNDETTAEKRETNVEIHLKFQRSLAKTQVLKFFEEALVGEEGCKEFLIELSKV